MVAVRSTIPIAADGQPQRDASCRQVLGQRGRSVLDGQPVESGREVRAERSVDRWLDAAGAWTRKYRRANDRVAGRTRPPRRRRRSITPRRSIVTASYNRAVTRIVFAVLLTGFLSACGTPN